MLRFLGIGAQKAGTSWLHAMLARHPGICFPAGKELHFWNHPHGAAAVAHYLGKFVDPTRAEGEITPAYALLNTDRVGEIRAAVPQLRLIYIIRNPMERAWSSALMALRRAELEPDEASDQWFIDHFRSRGSLGRGDYETCIRTWRGVFGDDALLILRFEDITLAPERLLARCFEHIGVLPVPESEMAAWGVHERVFEGLRYPLRARLRPVLRELYAARTESLGEYLGCDLSGWTL